MRYVKKIIFAVLSFSMSYSYAQHIDYQMPPKVIADLVDAPTTPVVSVSPDRQTLLLMYRPAHPSIEEIAQEELRIGGLRINPRTNGNSRSRYFINLTLQSLEEDMERSINGLPNKPLLENISWSPDGKTIICTHTTTTGLELWSIEVESRLARRLTDARVNDALGGLPYTWYPSGNKVLVAMIDAERGGAPQKPTVPNGPVVQENTKGAAPVRTYQDLLKSPFDEDLFEYYTQSTLHSVNVESGQSVPLPLKGINYDVEISPDGNYLLSTRLKRPFSYLVPYYRFAQEIAIYQADGKLVKVLAEIPAAEKIPKGFNAVRTGPRRHAWRADKPATVYWVEAQDKGDPKVEVDVRDRLYILEAPFKDSPEAKVDFGLRFNQVIWSTDDMAIAHEFWWSNRREMVSTWNPSSIDGSKKILFDRSYEDRYTDPGSFQTTLNEAGRRVLLRDEEGRAFLTGTGASPQGNRPFVDRLDLQTQETERLWRSEAPYYEIPIVLLDVKKGLLLTRRESKDDPPNYFTRKTRSDKIHQITQFAHPYLAMKGVSKDLIKYQRADGIDLTGTLYLPPDYDRERDGALPVLMWAYPREYKSKDAASQVRNSPYEFLRLYYGSPIYWALRGFAVFDNFAMPIIGEGDEESNDHFVPQLVSGAEAAIDKLVEMGVADPERLAVGGHSYGAFMTANLLAHCDLFSAGIARSGAYNRTLTPFGFQAEERTFWEAPDVYFTMSPFMHADKIKEPLLLIHGQADNNSGTYPMQSERFFTALKGHGATVRLVMLPHESHGYRARESIMHMLWEMDQWLEKYVKGAKKIQGTESSQKSEP